MNLTGPDLTNVHNDEICHFLLIYNVTVWKVWTWSGSRKNSFFFWGGGGGTEFMVRPKFYP